MARFDHLQEQGATPLLFGEEHPTIPDDIWEHVDTVVDTIGPAWSTGHDITPVVLKSLQGRKIQRFVYVSSTSVYGDHQGALVDEATKCLPGAAAGERRLRIEADLSSWSQSTGIPVIIARIAGIYGPGRSLIHRIQAGRYRRIAELNTYSNRIHVEDLAQSLLCLASRGEAGEVYNVADGHSALQHQVADYAAQFLEDGSFETVSLVQAEGALKPSHLAMVRESKRLSNEKLMGILSSPLRFPTYREGLQSIAESEGLTNRN
jgi:nucleoside-diphosphate-sugar epimerase